MRRMARTSEKRRWCFPARRRFAFGCCVTIGACANAVLYAERELPVFCGSGDSRTALRRRSARESPSAFAQFIQELRRVPRISIWEFHVIGGHHSNGQDGCLSTEQRLVPPPPANDGQCTPPGIVPTAETMNRIDGSFASQFFFRFGGNYSKNWMGDVTSPKKRPPIFRRRTARRVCRSAEYEWHPRKLVDDQMRDIYGRHRANLSSAYATRGIEWCPRRFEVSGGVVVNPGVVDSDLTWSGHLQASCFPWAERRVGFLCEVVRGPGLLQRWIS